MRRPRSFDINRKLLLVFYQAVIASIVFYAVVCWRHSIRKSDAK